jgi:hypothetical protein
MQGDHRLAMRPPPEPLPPHAPCSHCERATRLLERCETFLPSDLHALLEDVRAFIGINARGQRTAPRK